MITKMGSIFLVKKDIIPWVFSGSGVVDCKAQIENLRL